MRQAVVLLPELGSFVFDCPHCSGVVLVAQNEMHCRIFRHGVFKSNGAPINPHASKVECDRLLECNLIYGCGKPFQVFFTRNEQFAQEPTVV